MGEIIINTSGEYTNPATEGAVRNIASAVALPSTVLAYGQVSALAGSETQITSITSAKGIWVFAPLNADGTSANSYTVSQNLAEVCL